VFFFPVIVADVKDPAIAEMVRVMVTPLDVLNWMTYFVT
jgi:hypothetical protein